MALGEALEKLVLGAAKLVGTLQNGMNKVLWGTGKSPSKVTSNFNQQTGTIETTVEKQKVTEKIGNFIQSGLFNALDVLNQVDLCNVLTYLLDNINVKQTPRPEKPWTATQSALFFLQDQAFVVQKAIDKYLAYPNVFIGDYVGQALDPITNKEASNGSGLPEGFPDISGIAVAKYNIFNLTKSIQDVFDSNPLLNSPAFTTEDRDLLRQVPGLASNINVLDDLVKSINKYADYREISNEDLVKLQKQINTLRSICVVIQNLNFQSTIALAGNFLNTDIRSQVQKLSQFMDPTQIMKVLKQINNSIRAFIAMANKIQGIIAQAQFIIKIAILFVKVFKFIQAFFIALPLPNLFTTSGVQTALTSANEAAKDTSKGLVNLLKQVNALLSVVLSFVRYILANANELQLRLQNLLTNLEACAAVKDSDVVAQLRQTSAELAALQITLGAYVDQYDNKTNSETTQFGTYEIRVIQEEVVESTVQNRRRRGIALDVNGAIVLQSDLTFATNNAVIIGEVKLKLVAAGLVLPSLATLDNSDLAVISESIDFLDNNDVLSSDLNLETTLSQDTPDNTDENVGLGLNAFINNLRGGKKLRKRVRASLDNASANLGSQIKNEGINATSAIKGSENIATSVGGNESTTG